MFFKTGSSITLTPLPVPGAPLVPLLSGCKQLLPLLQVLFDRLLIQLHTYAWFFRNGHIPILYKGFIRSCYQIFPPGIIDRVVFQSDEILGGRSRMDTTHKGYR